MVFKKKKAGDGVFKSILVAYAILFLHVLLIAGLGMLVLFFRGIVQYMIWIFLGGTALVLGSAYYFYRRMKAEGKSLHEMLKSPVLNGRAVEVSFLGGIASVKLGRPPGRTALEDHSTPEYRQLDDPGAARVKELNELARLLHKNLITVDEYNRAKQQLFKEQGTD